MNVQLLVTHSDYCLPNLECELISIGIKYQIAYIEDNAALVDANNIRHSPNIFVDNQLVFRYQPTTSELQHFFKLQ